MTISTERLLPCPFCGSDFLMGQEPYDNHPVAGQFYLYHRYGAIGSAARSCPIEVRGHFDTAAEAIAAWNRRSGVEGREAVIEVALLAAQDLAKTMEGFTACRSDDDYVWSAQEKIAAAIRALTKQTEA